VVAQAARASKEQHLTELASMGIGQGQLQPTLRHQALQRRAGLKGGLAALAFLAIVFGANSFDLKLP
jgi:hypothetical protein